MHIVLAGNPNCGKTTLFNTLTGDNQRVGNWPGVTVEKKTGTFSSHNQLITLTDLPGIYSLSADTNSPSLDETIAAQALVDIEADFIINIVNACHLERNFYLTSQLLELGKPMILVLNMMDLAQKQGISIDIKRLSQLLHCPVVCLQAHTGLGIDQLHHALQSTPTLVRPLSLSLDQHTQQVFTILTAKLLQNGASPTFAQYSAYRLLEGGNTEYDADIDMILADARYQAIHDLVNTVQKKQSDASEQITAKIDKIVLHRFLAFPIFFAMMYLMFLFAINIGGAFQDFFDISTDTIFVQGSAWGLQQLHAPGWLIALIANGIGKGINTTLTFIPVIASMFFFLSLLEASGYMARAAFVVDKAMRAMGLPGKSFVPMIVGFGCNVPAIMAARTLDSERDRLLTVLMSPFMSCSARLAIYAVFVAAFFPSGGQNIVFSLYLIGIIMAVLTGFLLRKTLFKGDASPLILELPAYHKPSLTRLFKETGLRLKFFVWRAGKLIVPICVILGALNALTLDGSISMGEANSQSILSFFGQLLTPLFAPMGLHQDNWPATVGLLTGMLAKEVVVGSLNALYAQMGQLPEAATTGFNLLGGLQEALWSIPHNLSQLGSALINPIVASAPNNPLSQSVYGVMVKRFDGQAGAYAYLLFILLYIPCVSTMAVIRQEANRNLMWLSIVWSFIVAYSAAVLFYQIARFSLHPQLSSAWIIGIITLLLLGARALHHYGQKKEIRHVITAA
jgi:ferrous iron transport protein B